MAENENILQRLGKLFQNQIVLRKTDDGEVKVKDVEFSQTALTSNFIDRYNRINSSGYGNSSYQARQNANAYDVARKELFRDYELMDADPIISSALDIYSDECTIDNIQNEILKIKTDNAKVLLQSLLDEATVLICHNAQHELAWLWETGFTYEGAIFDTMLVEYLFQRSVKEPLSLEAIAERYD